MQHFEILVPSTTKFDILWCHSWHLYVYAELSVSFFLNCNTKTKQKKGTKYQAKAGTDFSIPKDGSKDEGRTVVSVDCPDGGASLVHRGSLTVSTE